MVVVGVAERVELLDGGEVLVDIVDVPPLDHLVVAVHVHIVQLELVEIILLCQVVILDVPDLLAQVDRVLSPLDRLDAVITILADLGNSLQAHVHHLGLWRIIRGLRHQAILRKLTHF